MRRELYARVAKALEADNRISVTIPEAQTSPGFPESYFALLGLSRGDLKLLERYGLALRGYTKNVWLEGETTPKGRVVAKGFRANGPGHRLRWLLIAEGAPRG